MNIDPSVSDADGMRGQLNDVAAAVAVLVAKDAIRDTFAAFCTAMARADVDLAMSAFAPGAVDVHPPMGQWSREEMPGRLASVFGSMFTDAQYFMGNMTIEMTGPSTAKSETLVWCSKRVLDTDEYDFAYHRLSGMVYFDRWADIDGEWLITARRFVPVWEIFHSIGAESDAITRNYRPVSPSANSVVDRDIDYVRVAAEFWSGE